MNDANGRTWYATAITFIRDVGFPIFVSLYLLFSLGPKIDAMKQSVDRCVITLEARR